MKKVFSLVLAGALILAAATAFADAKRLTLATGGTSGVYFPLGGAIGQVLTSKSNGALAITAQATGRLGRKYAPSGGRRRGFRHRAERRG